MTLEICTLNAPRVYASPGDFSTVFLLLYVISMVSLISVCCFGLWQWMLGPLGEVFEDVNWTTEFRTVVGVVFTFTSALLVSLFYGRFSSGERRANTILFSKQMIKTRIPTSTPTSSKQQLAISLQLVDILKTPVIKTRFTLQLFDLDTWEIHDLRLTGETFLLTCVPWTFTHVLECDSPLLLRPRPLHCADCRTSFRSTRDLERHMTTLHNKTPLVDYTMKGNFKLLATLSGTEPVSGEDFIVRKIYEIDEIEDDGAFPSIAHVLEGAIAVDFAKFHFKQE